MNRFAHDVAHKIREKGLRPDTTKYYKNRTTSEPPPYNGQCFKHVLLKGSNLLGLRRMTIYHDYGHTILISTIRLANIIFQNL